jgi:branched-chain amino acid transport system ATP-binding protein
MCGSSGDVDLNAATQGDAPRENRSRPKLLLVDEPSVGLAPLMVRELSRTLRDIHREGVAILLVEQNASIALALASGGYLLETGRVMAQGDTATLLANDYVRRAYLAV